MLGALHNQASYREHVRSNINLLIGEKFHVETFMSIHLGKKDLLKSQQMEVAVNGPDGATHLILCTGIAELSSVSREIYDFLVGPKLTRRQFVGAIVSGALSRIRICKKNSTGDIAELQLEANLISINANFDDEAGQVKVCAEISSSKAMMKLGISYNVSILAELPIL